MLEVPNISGKETVISYLTEPGILNLFEVHMTLDFELDIKYECKYKNQFKAGSANANIRIFLEVFKSEKFIIISSSSLSY